ncbi:proliferation marker protein Ki-67 [Trichomycterus rosablanca]|uniref:proliferation marker protein Ki-67 n=1 Tax=Trichomycterus rosablanca TaxID=2290929 RepID=UPI002F351B21
MPLLGKIVVIKRNGTDGTEFPLTASCLFGRKLDCDIRIQLPQVSKEHCRIELNENKELILTNLSSVNPTRINGEILQQSERLKDGDLITIIDRSFRFEYPPPPTPKKKRLSTPRKSEAIKVLQDQQVKSSPASTEKKSEHLSDTCLKDGSNLPTQDQSAGDAKTNTENTSSPFSDLYNMVKRDLATKPQWKSATLSNTPTSKLPVNKEEPKKVSASGTENEHPVTPQSTKKRRRSSSAKFVNGSDVIELSDQVENLAADVKIASPAVQNAAEKQKRRSQSLGTPVSQKKTPQTTPQKFTAQEVAQQIAFESPSTKQTPKSPKSPRRSSPSEIPAVTPEEQTTPKNPSEPTETPEAQAKPASRTSPRANAGKRFQVQDVLNEIVSTDDSDDNVDGQTSSKKHKRNNLPLPAAKRKRVSFGGLLSPELFDKRLPPDSPLRRGATPGRRSLSFFPKPQSLLRRASTIGLMGFRFGEKVPESPVKSASPKRLAKTPSPAKKSPATKAKTPSPKTPKTSPKTPASSPRPASPKTPAASSKSASPKTPAASSSRSASPKTPKSASKVSNSSLNTQSKSEGSLLMTPTTHGRFSVSIISTPSPVANQEKVVEEESVPVVEEPQKCVTPKNPVRRRSSLRASSRKTPMSSLKNMVRSRRSGASLANLKVLSSWADIVKFGQAKSQMEGGAKKTTSKQKAAKQTKVIKPKTPARRLLDHPSTGHADSPATIVVGKAYLRSTHPVGAAPKVVCNLALRKEDMKMDEDLTGVADIFKTPANSRRKSAIKNGTECTQTPVGGTAVPDEMSVMMTPEESGEMMVSPLSVASTAKCQGFNSEAVTRLLQDDQNGSLIEEMNTSDSSALEAPIPSALESSSEDQAEAQVTVQTPQRQPEPSECLTGVKRLMRTPKQKAEPIEDLRGKLLKTPKEPKNPQEESLEGLKELLKTPKQKVTPVEDMAGLKELMTTPVVKHSPDVAQRRSAKSPEDKTVQDEDLTGVTQLMKTPNVRGAPVEDSFGVKRLLRTPKEKNEPVEDLTGIQQMMKTPKQKSQLVEEDLTGIKQMMETPQQKVQPTEVDLTGVKQMKTPQQKAQPAEVELTGVKQTKSPKQKAQPAEVDLTGIKNMMKTPKQKSKLVEEDLTGIKQMMETPKLKAQSAEVDLTGIQMTKTPKQKAQPAEEDLTDIKQMMKTPKQKAQPAEEDLTDIKQMMKTPKQKSQPVEDMVGIRRLLRTPKEKQQPVEKDFEIGKLMKTPKPSAAEVVDDSQNLAEHAEEAVSKSSACLTEMVQMDKNESLEVHPEDKENICPVEDMDTEAAGGVQNISQINVEDAETKTSQDVEEVTSVEQNAQEPQVESDSVEGMIEETVVHAVESSQVSAPVKGRRGRGKAIADLVEDIPTQSPARKSTRGKTSKTEVKIALKPRRGMKSEDVKPVVNIEDSKASEPLTSLKSPAPSKAKRGRKAEQESENQSISTVTEEPEAVVDKPAVRARRGRAANKETQKTVQPEDPKPAPVNDESNLQLSEAVVNEREPEALAEIEEPVKSNTRSRRGKVTTKKSPRTEPVEDSETATVNESDTTSSEAERTPEPVDEALRVSAEPQPSETEAPAKANSRSRRGKVEKKGISKAAPVEAPEPTTVSEDPDKSSEAVVVAVPENAEPDAPVKSNTRSRRGKAAKQETPKTQIENVSESVSTNEEAAVSSETRLKLSAETELPVKSNARSRRGKANTKESSKTEQFEETNSAPTIKADIKRPQGDVDEAVPVSAESSEAEFPSSSNSRSRKGRTMQKKALKTDQVEKTVEATPVNKESDNDNGDAVEVKPGRGRRAKLVSSKDHEVDEPRAEGIAAVTDSAEPVVESVVKNVRGGRRATQPKGQVSEKAQEKVQAVPENDSDEVQRSDAPAVKSTRGKRTATVRVEPEVPVKRGRRAAAAEVPAPVVKPSRGRKAAVKPEVKEITDDAPAAVEETNQVTEPVVETKPAPAEDSDSHDNSSIKVSAKRGRGRAAKTNKASNKDASVNEAEEPAATDAHTDHEGKVSKKAVNWNSDLVTWKNIGEFKPPAEEEPKQKSQESADPPAKGRKGRVTKKQEEPEKPKPTVEENVTPVRRGRTGASAVSKLNEAVVLKRGQKIKEVEVGAEETPVVESLPKRRRGKAADAKTPAKEVEDIAEVEAEETKPASMTHEKPARGRRKATPETPAVRTQAEDPAEEVTTRRGTRAHKKEEADVASAPVRRTRRK